MDVMLWHPCVRACVCRLTHDDICVAFYLSSLQVLSGENWNTVMYDAIRATSLGVGAAYFIAMIILGAMVVLELFVAILLGGFGEEEEEPEPPPVISATGALMPGENAAVAGRNLPGRPVPPCDR